MIGAKEKMIPSMNKRVKIVFVIFSLVGCVEITCNLDNFKERTPSFNFLVAMTLGGFRFIT